MQYGKIICYSLRPANLTRKEIDQFQRKLNGRNDRSNFGKYTYYREGHLHKIPHIKPVRSVLVVSLESSLELLEFLERYSAEVFARDILLEKEDVKKLEL
jgi:hypothetical protein